MVVNTNGGDIMIASKSILLGVERNFVSSRSRIVCTIMQCFIVLLCIGALFVHSRLLTDPYIVPKWLFALLVVFCMGVYCSIRILLNKSVMINMSQVGMSITIICCLQAMYGLLQYVGLVFSDSVYTITGTFDNPAGFAGSLCAGLPFVGFWLLNENNKYVRYLGWVIAVIIIMAVGLSHSRAGMISVAALCIVLLWQKFRLKRVLKYVVLSSLILLMIGSYWIKKDSADGRILIWQCSLEMVKDAPWIGHGIGSFEAHYMDYQSDYFKQHEQSRFSMLADNVKQPFNEYLGVLLNFGVIGLLVLAAMIGIIIYCYEKHPTTEKKIALYSLIAIGTFSLFSYPFTYPFVWIVTFLSVFMITGEYIKRLFSRGWIKNTVCVLVLGCSLFGFYKLIDRIGAELEWGKASVSYYESMPVYEKLEKKFKSNPYFLYNYAAVLQEKKQYDRSLQVALECRQYWADYDLELVIGENYQQLSKPELAEEYYKSASLMCPSRFLPLYKLFHLYKENGRREEAIAMAETVISKPMKIKTASIRMIKREMEREKLKLNETTE